MALRALIALAVLALAAANLTATSDRPASRPRPSQRDVAATPAPTRTPVPPKLGRAVIDRQDRSTRRERERESRAFDSRPLLTRLPLELAGVRIDIAGLAADGRTTILSIDPGTRSRAHARAVYEHALAAYRDSGHAYGLEWARRAASRPSASEDGTP
jgi:hypothetical protein